MKKTILLLICLCCICFIGCSTSNNTNSENENTPAPFVEKIEYRIGETYSGEKFAMLYDVSTRQKEINILEEYQGVPVSVINTGALRDCTTLENITIPDSITEISDHAFVGCSSLKSITVPDTVLKFGINVFEDCNALEYAYLGTGICTSVTNYTKWFDLFKNCYSLKEISIPFDYLYRIERNESYEDVYPISAMFGGDDVTKYNSIFSTYGSDIDAPYENLGGKYYLVPKTLKCIEIRESIVRKYSLYGWEDQLDTIKLNHVNVVDRYGAMSYVKSDTVVFA